MICEIIGCLQTADEGIFACGALPAVDPQRLFGVSDEFVQRVNALNGVFAYSRFGGQRKAGCAVDNRVDHVMYFSPRRLPLANHGLQQVRSDINLRIAAASLLNDHLLGERNSLDGNLFTQVASIDQDGIRLVQDFVQIV